MRFFRDSNPSFLVALVILSSVGCKKPESDPRNLPELVRLAKVLPADGAGATFTGLVTARTQGDIGFRVAGKITRRLVDLGQTVRRGQALMEIDVTDFANAITARAEDVIETRAKAEQAIADEVRYRGLVATGAVSASAYDRIKANADAARAQLASSEAQARIAKNQGSYTVLEADADGVIVETLADVGQVVAAGQTVIKLAHSGPREATVNLPEGVRPRIGSFATVSLYGNNAAPLTARLRQMSDAADPTTRTFEARYVLRGPVKNAPLGSTLTVHLPDSKTENTKVPLAAITDPGDGPGVWIFSRTDSKVRFRHVQICLLGNEEAVLKSGVQAGEKIVALGAHLLSEGEAVRVEEKVANR